MSRFIVKRKDKLNEVDDLVIESEGLTVGRVIGNDLVLNHPAVSRTHGGIKEIKGDYWFFNLSKSNGTLLNGQLVDRTPLADGDVVQVGPYLLQLNYLQSALSISVDLEPDVQPLAIHTGGLGEGQSAGTVLMKIGPKPGNLTITPGGTRRLEGTGLLATALPSFDEEALEVFWEKRKREAGKIAAESPLQPSSDHRVGKAQFNWRPTLDLKRLRKKSYFAWGVILVFVLSATAIAVYDNAYSPGDLSLAHTTTQSSARNIAVSTNAGSCSACHALGVGMDASCASCHTTQSSQQAQGFQPTVYDAHEREGMTCTSCHTEHSGEDIRAALVTYNVCANCHNDSYLVRSGAKAGQVLGNPHGGGVGYPVVNGRWEWPGLSAQRWKAKGLPESWANYSSRDQFHVIHQKGKMLGRMRCTDCHTAGVRTDEGLHKSPRNECAKCHGVSAVGAGFRPVAANCYTCHQQHGRSEDAAKLVPPGGKDQRKLKEYLAAMVAGVEVFDPDKTAGAPLGSAEVIRQSRDRLTLRNLGTIGGVPLYVWVGLAALLPIIGLLRMGSNAVRERRLFKSAANIAAPVPMIPKVPTGSLDLDRIKAEGPPYPHPVIDPVLCIGCHACVEACPHDVLAIVNGIATPVAIEQCMEDTSCQVECPTNPKACIVINTTKVIPPRKVPARNQSFMTNVEGIYLIGDVSGVPLIKNAVNEGAQVIDQLVEDLRGKGGDPRAEYDVAIIGAGPAGLSAAVLAKQRGLSYVAVEQDKVAATIQAYPAEKYVFFKPDTVHAKGGIPLPGPGEKKETVIESWLRTMTSNGIQIQEEESCKDIKRDGGFFSVVTEKSKQKETATYTARRVILAIGNRGTPMKLGVRGEDRKIEVRPEPQVAKHCPRCGAASRKTSQFCVSCGAELPKKIIAPYQDLKVKYKLSDPDDYVDKACLVVGAGNSAVEAAVDLCGLKREGNKITFTRDNRVTLVVRSDFKSDLKLGNKMNIYDCIDAGKVKVLFRTEVKEIREKEVVLMDVRTKEESMRMPNDFVFALIGGEKPTKFLEALGIKIG